jgi:hypothetical protein
MTRQYCIIALLVFLLACLAVAVTVDGLHANGYTTIFDRHSEERRSQ